MKWLWVKRQLPAHVKLLVVSKGRKALAMQALYEQGQLAFAENYVQEAREKMAYFADQSDIEWHFIGRIQSNKTTFLAENFAWVQTVDRLSIAERLNAARSSSALPLNICIAVNISEEAQKTGVLPEAVLDFAKSILSLKQLKLRGLFAIPKSTDNPDEQLNAFNHLARLQKNLLEAGIAVDTLSMGMSQDYPMAIAAGSTCVRIGQLIWRGNS